MPGQITNINMYSLIKFGLINLINHTKSESDQYLYIRNNPFNLDVRVMDSQRLFCGRKSDIESFWYTKTFKLIILGNFKI